MYYPRGVATILDIVWAKVLRMYSVVEGMENDPSYNPNFESLEDSLTDMAVYCAMFSAYLQNEHLKDADIIDKINFSRLTSVPH